MLKSVGLVSVIILACLVLGIILNFAREGYQRASPNNVLVIAQTDWQDGKISEAVPLFVLSFKMALESQVRWTIADSYINKMKDLKKNRQLHEALAECNTARQILDTYDDEGGMDYECVVIQEEIDGEIPIE